MLRKSLIALIDRMCREEPNVNSDNSVSWHAYREAEQLSDPSMVDEFSEFLNTEKEKKRRAAAYFIVGKLGLKCRSADCARILIGAISREKDRYIVSSILDRLAAIEKPREVDLSPIFPLLKESKWIVRQSAIGALAKSDSSEAEVEVIAVLIATSDPNDIICCNQTLGEIGSMDAIPHIEKNLTSRKRDVKYTANYAVQSIMARHGVQP